MYDGPPLSISMLESSKPSSSASTSSIIATRALTSVTHPRLVRRVLRGHEENALEAQLVASDFRRSQMTEVQRIERAAEHTHFAHFAHFAHFTHDTGARAAAMRR